MTDTLTRATEALRAETTGDDPRLELATRLRLRRSLAERARGRRRLAIVAALVAFLFGGTTAWAIATGRVDRVWSALRGEPAPPLEAEVAVTAPAPTPRTVAPRVAIAASEVDSPAPEVDSPAPEVDSPAPEVDSSALAGDPAPPGPRVVERTVRRTAPRATGPALPVPAATIADAPITDVEATYRRAHDLHFRGGDLAAALAAWDAYLAAEPDGRFAAEARYNRALVLARLGRYADAHAALVPYARGEIAGGYRRAEAAALIERLAPFAGTP